MEKRYSIFSGDFSRVHPLTLIGIVAFVLVFLTSGIFRTISIIVFIVAFLGLVVLKIYRNNEFKKEG